jgi:hypothetical protein
VKAARITKAMISGRSAATPAPETPSAPITTCSLTSCSAIYGIVATIPVIVNASASQRLPKRPRTKSPAVMYWCLWQTFQIRGKTRKKIGYATIVYGTAKNATAPAPKASAGTAIKV